ncbi:MAG: hypothetical protein QW589_00895 [Candidatus Bathyarchaeia archaeon]
MKFIFYALLILYAFNSFFLALRFINLLKLEYMIVYTPKTVEIIILSNFLDEFLLYGLFTGLIALISFIRIPLRLKISKVFYLVYLCFPLALLNHLLDLKGIEVAVLMLLNLLILYNLIVFIKTITFMPKFKALTLFLLGILFIPLIIEFGSAITWFFNIIIHVLDSESSIGWIFISKEIEFFNLLFSTSFHIVYPILFSWIWIPVFQYNSEQVFRFF